MCSCFSQLVFEQANVTQDDIKTEEDMKKFFANFACETSSLTGDRMKYPKDSSERFTAKMIYKGYIDDPRNTDNAWVEAEIWNFHYPNQDKLNDYIPNVSSYKYQIALNKLKNTFIFNFSLQVSGKKFHHM